jgi:hypothetical protein
LDGQEIVVQDTFRSYTDTSFLLEYRLNIETNAFTIDQIISSSQKHRLSDLGISLFPIEIANHIIGSPHWFFKNCDVCLRYEYSSDDFIFDLKSASVKSIDIISECGSFVKPRDEDMMGYVLTRMWHKNDMRLDYGPFATHLLSKITHLRTVLENHIYLPWMELDFSSPNDLIKRLDTIIFFS